VTRSSTPSSTALPPCPATVAGIRTIFHPNGPHQVTGVGNPPGLARRSDNAAGNAVPGLGLGNQLAAAGVAPPPGHDPLPGDRVKGVGGVGARCACATRPCDPPARLAEPAAIRDRDQTQPPPDQGSHDRTSPLEPLR
jgi:hypothetical protein